MTKLMYCSKQQVPAKQGKSERIRIANLPRSDIDLLESYLRAHCVTELSHDAPITVHTTGVGVKQFGKQIREKLNIK